MANKVQLKKSSVAARVPLTTDVDYGELALNYADGKLYYKKSDGTTIDYFPSVGYIPLLSGSYANPTWITSLAGSKITGDISGNAGSATVLQTARTINGVSFNGSANITVADSTKLPLAGGTMSGAIGFAAGQTWPTFNQNTTGSAGSVAWTGITGKPTTLSGYGITDGQTTLVSGTNIKTVNGTSLLGSGDLAISASTVPWTGVTSKPSNIMYYQGFTLDANTMDSNSTGFTYSINAPATGPVARFSTGGGYDLWLNSSYGNGNTLYFRTRQGDAGTLNSWKALVSYGINYADSLYSTIMYDSNNTGYYCDPNSTSSLSYVYANRIILDRNYGHSIFGTYSSTRYQGVWSMGQPWALPDDGTTTGNLYGLAWSHPNAGGIAGNLNTHGLLVLENGGFLAALSGSIRCRDDMRTPIYYDSNDTGYYIDPNTTGVAYRGRGQILLGPNTSSRYFRIGGDGGATDYSTITVSNGNLHLDAQTGYNIYLAWYNTSNVNVGGGVVANGNITAYSDERLKKDWLSLPVDYIERLAKVKNGTYTRIDNENRQAGSSAQDWQLLLPEVVEETGDDKTLSLAYGNAALVSTIELAKRVVEQNTRIARLEELISKLIDN